MFSPHPQTCIQSISQPAVLFILCLFRCCGHIHAVIKLLQDIDWFPCPGFFHDLPPCLFIILLPIDFTYSTHHDSPTVKLWKLLLYLISSGAFPVISEKIKFFICQRISTPLVHTPPPNVVRKCHPSTLPSITAIPLPPLHPTFHHCLPSTTPPPYLPAVFPLCFVSLSNPSHCQAKVPPTDC